MHVNAAEGSTNTNKKLYGTDRKKLEDLCTESFQFTTEDSDAHVSFSSGVVNWVLRLAKPILEVEPLYLKLRAPIRIVGDVHGQYEDLLKIFLSGGFPPEACYLFLGDYVDRGKHSVPCILLLLLLKVLFPSRIYLLRGNHECESINRVYGFFEECKKRYTASTWKKFNVLFGYLPLAACVNDRIFCIHGGLSPDFNSPEDISHLTKPVSVGPTGIVVDFLWSDPDADIEGFAQSDRGISFNFGSDVVSDFLQRNDLDLIVRAHQVVEDGYEFFANRQLVTVFSAPNYCGEFDNAGSVLCVSEDLVCSFEVLMPHDGIVFEHEARPQTPSLD